MHAVVEEFPLGGDNDKPKVKCIALQNEAGGAARRIAFDSPEADRMRKLFPALAELGDGTGDQPKEAA